MDSSILFSANCQEHAARAPFPTAAPKPLTSERYYAGPSKYSAGSWNVYDRMHLAPEGGHAVEDPHLTHRQAVERAEELNSGSDSIDV
jgi:hypothetical protein